MKITVNSSRSQAGGAEGHSSVGRKMEGASVWCSAWMVYEGGTGSQWIVPFVEYTSEQ